MWDIDNVLSTAAIILSIFSLGISLYFARLEDTPYICLKGIKFLKNNFEIIPYSERLSESIRTVIDQTKESISVQKICGKEYLPINLLDKNEQNYYGTEIVLSPMECFYISRGGYINEMVLKKASMKFKKSGNEKEPGVSAADIKMQNVGREEKMVLLDGNEIVIRIAYIHKGPKKPSIDYSKLKNEEEDFDYLMDIDKANEYINFEFEKFVFYFKNYKGREYKREIVLKMDKVKGLVFELHNRPNIFAKKNR